MMRNKAKIYAQVMAESFEGLSRKEAERRVQRLKQLLRKRGDLKIVSNMLQEFSRAWKERKGQAGQVVTAEALSKQARQKIAKSLKGKGYIMEERVDPDVIGGMAVFLGSEFLIDGTVRGKLKRLAKVLQI